MSFDLFFKATLNKPKESVIHYRGATEFFRTRQTVLAMLVCSLSITVSVQPHIDNICVLVNKMPDMDI